MPKTLPILISHKTFKNIDKAFKQSGGTQFAHHNWKNNVGSFYTDYIKPNQFPLLVMIILVVYLTIRYFIKQNKKKSNRLQDNRLQSNTRVAKKHKKSKKRQPVKRLVERTDDTDQSDQSDQSSYHPLVTSLPQLNPDHMESDDMESIYALEKEYSREKEEGLMSDQMLKELYQAKNTKLSFDELARVFAGQ
jgi:hypothetical protein